MKQLYPKQREALDFLKAGLLNTGGALDSSRTGLGKTVVASHLALEMGVPVAVICPKITIPNWERELAEVGVEPLFVLNYEKLRTGRHKFLTKRGKKTFSWNLPTDTLLIWDEAHYCKSPFTQNSAMLIASVRDGFKNLLLSATACQDPTEMRSIGYALGAHSLQKAVGPKRSWFTWMAQYKCRRDVWGKWVAGPTSALKPLHEQLYATNCIRLVPDDLPNAFKENVIITEPLAFAGLKDIASFYESHGITPEIVEMYLEDGAASPHVLVEMLRARQLAEAAKVPDIIQMINDGMDEGYSLPVFVNFTDTLDALRSAFPDASVIAGGQSGAERERNVQRFQNNETKVILCNIQAGGVGISLHDEFGGHPRMSLISPTFNSKQYDQTLGRIHRAKSKSPAIQRVLVASETIEEKVVDSMEKKRVALELLHGGSESGT